MLSDFAGGSTQMHLPLMLSDHDRRHRIPFMNSLNLKHGFEGLMGLLDRPFSSMYIAHFADGMLDGLVIRHVALQG